MTTDSEMFDVHIETLNRILDAIASGDLSDAVDTLTSILDAKPQNGSARGADGQMRPNAIRLFFHCGKCIDEKPDDVTPRDWARIEVGWTDRGIQVWCKRHEVQIMHVDSRGTSLSRTYPG